MMVIMGPVQRVCAVERLAVSKRMMVIEKRWALFILSYLGYKMRWAV